MKVAVMSDSHDRIKTIRKAIEQIQGLAEVLIHCGDYCAPFMMNELARFTGEIHGCFGNVDGDIFLITKFSQKIPNMTLYHPLGEITVDGKKIAFTHFPPMARGLAATGDYDAVFYGHSHEFKIDQIKNTLLVNDGEIMGRKGRPCFALYDTETNQVEQ